MADGTDIVATASSVLVVDWPSRDVPDTLALAGKRVIVHGGPGPEDYSLYEVIDGEVTVRHLGTPPEQADLIYSHRPLDELPGLVAIARRIGATAIWTQSGLADETRRDPKGCWVDEAAARRAREIVEAAGLAYFDHPYIADLVRDTVQ